MPDQVRHDGFGTFYETIRVEVTKISFTGEGTLIHCQNSDVRFRDTFLLTPWHFIDYYFRGKGNFLVTVHGFRVQGSGLGGSRVQRFKG